MRVPRRHRLTPLARLVVAALASVATLAACGQRVPGTPIAAEPPAGDEAGPPPERATAPPGPLGGTAAPGPGSCLDSQRSTFAPCEAPHDIEITRAGQLPPGLPTDYPDEQTMLRAALPPCRAALAGYLDSPDGDATRLQAWAFWPNRDRWARGDRWLLCAATELGPDGRPVSRTGSVRGALAGDGFDAFQLCTAGSPSREQQLRTVSCDQPHLGEALPGVLNLGAATDPMPDQRAMNTAAREHCTRALADYLGTASRGDVFPAWRMPGVQDWAQGYTDVTCYAEIARPVTARLRGIGSAPLPG
ncbi:septum formation family protein [Gandjariella thermophila]|uniref:Septum formation-related domain-containing protein n=1 Tax=Gandjariella thermophila TaxID=1931992 RepID=A0A4D4J8X1_9PSEU|nr:septum formation family protein [Gandjariella thermophila]GDY30859.1 hypothetical protein GTS_24920 [Gandjariella thermophila]